MEIGHQSIKVANPPNIPGLAFRGFRGPVDHPIMAQIANAAHQADQIDITTTAEAVAKNVDSMSRVNLDRDMLFVEIDNRAVGYGYCYWIKDRSGQHQYIFTFFMSPAGRLTGLGETVTTYFMQHLKEIAVAEHPAEAPKIYKTWANNSEQWMIGLLEKQQFAIDQYGIRMVRPCSQPIEVTALPEGIFVRRPKPEEYRKLWEAKNEAFRNQNDTEPIEADYQSWLNWPHYDPALWKVAWDGDEIVGMVLNYINKDENQAKGRQRGYTETIGVRSAWRKQGIARALLTQSIQMFQKIGMDETALGVETKNPNDAKHLYESVGYVEEERFMFYQKPFSSKTDR